MSGAQSPAVLRAASILDVLSDSAGRALTLSDISRKIDVPKSTTATICAALLETGLIQYGTGGYSLGRRLVELGGAYLTTVEPLADLYDLCRSLPYASRETVRIAVLDGLDVLYLFIATGQRPLRLSAEVGDRKLAPHTATGKAMLAKLPEDDLERLLVRQPRFPATTPASIRTAEELRQALVEVRRKGYAVDDEEAHEGIFCVSVAAETQAPAPNRLMAVSATLLKPLVSEALTKELLSDLAAIANYLARPLGASRLEALVARRG